MIKDSVLKKVVCEFGIGISGQYVTNGYWMFDWGRFPKITHEQGATFRDQQTAYMVYRWKDTGRFNADTVLNETTLVRLIPVESLLELAPLNMFIKATDPATKEESKELIRIFRRADGRLIGINERLYEAFGQPVLFQSGDSVRPCCNAQNREDVTLLLMPCRTKIEETLKEILQ